MEMKVEKTKVMRICIVVKNAHFRKYIRNTQKIWNMVLQKDGEDQLDLSSEKWRSITYSQGRKEHPTHNKEEEG